MAAAASVGERIARDMRRFNRKLKSGEPIEVTTVDGRTGRVVSHGTLNAGRRQAIVAAPPKRSLRVGRKRSEPDPETYSGRVALRLRRLREERGWSVKQLAAELAKVGKPVPVSTIYAYESGRNRGGADLPSDLYPAYAAAFGIGVRTLLPAS